MKRFILGCGVVLGFFSLAFAADPSGSYESDLDDLQERINASQEGREPRLPTSRERVLEDQLAVMQDRAVKAEEALAVCETALGAKE